MVLRLYGSENLRDFIRDHVNLAKKFEDYVAQDQRFEVIYKISYDIQNLEPKYQTMCKSSEHP